MKVRFITPYYGVKGMRLLTLPCLAAEFAPYCDVELCDQNVEAVDFSDCDMVGISLLVYNAPLGYEIAARFREKGIPVGNYTSSQGDPRDFDERRILGPGGELTTFYESLGLTRLESVPDSKAEVGD